MKKENDLYCTIAIYGLTAQDCVHMGMRLRTHFQKLTALEPAPKADSTYAKMEYRFSQAFALDTGPRQADIDAGLDSIIGYLRKNDGPVHTFHTSFVRAAQNDRGHYHNHMGLFADPRTLRRLKARRPL